MGINNRSKIIKIKDIGNFNLNLFLDNVTMQAHIQIKKTGTFIFNNLFIGSNKVKITKEKNKKFIKKLNNDGKFLVIEF